MVTYEITSVVAAELREDYERFMCETHIPDLMNTGAFIAASFSRSSPGRYRVRYEARSRAHLEAYLAEHAPRLRRHFNESFPSGIELAREEWDVLESWPRLLREG